ncbi:unnamed protein product [Linum trigynum]|uniref:Uncharacterized protein n=1 Tax=Linum trigynum TaxID=586398 RepID=A0AAV2FX42_9ROSI
MEAHSRVSTVHRKGHPVQVSNPKNDSCPPRNAREERPATPDRNRTGNRLLTESQLTMTHLRPVDRLERRLLSLGRFAPPRGRPTLRRSASKLLIGAAAAWFFSVCECFGSDKPLAYIANK